MKITKYPKDTNNAHPFITVVPDDYSASKSYPLVTHLHGTGGQQGLDSLIAGELPEQIQKAVDIYKFIAIAPQTGGSWTNAETDHVLEWAKNNLPINWAKNYLLGTSLGGGGLTRYLSASVANARKFAGAVSACGLNWLSTPKNIADANLPVIFFHAADDITVGPNATHQAVSSINAFPMTVPAKKVIYTAGQHWIWNKVFHATERPWTGNESPKTLWDYIFMLEVGKPLPVPNLVPSTDVVVDAGPDQAVTTDRIVLNGSNSRNYKTLSWSLDRSPAGINPWTVFYKGSGFHTVDAQLEKPGVYVFKLTGTDAAGAKIEDTVQVTYNAAAPVPIPVPDDKVNLTIQLKVYESGKIEGTKI